MKNRIYILFTTFFSVFTYAQNGVGIGNNSPRGILEVNKNDGKDTMGIVLPVVPSVDIDTLDASAGSRRYIPSVVKPLAKFSELNYTVTMEGNTIDMKRFAPEDPISAAAPLGTIAFDESRNCIRINNNPLALGVWQDCIVDSQDVEDHLNYVMYGAENFKLKKASAGYYFSLGIGEDDYLYSAGYGGYYATGTGNYSATTTWRRIYNFEKIVDVQAGYFNGFAITESGKLLGWGYNFYGMLGDPSTVSRMVTNPKVIEVSTNTSGVKQIAAAYYHTLVLMNDGTVYASGFNGWGITGQGTEYNYLTEWTKVNFPELPNGAKILNIDASAYSSAAVDDKGNLYTWGGYTYGLSGWGTAGSTTTPRKHVFPQGTKINKVATNAFSGIALGSNIDGDIVLYNWGLRYIIGNTGYVTSPTLVSLTNLSSLENNEKIIDIKGTIYYPSDGVVYYITDKNNIYAAGSYAYGKLGAVNFETGGVDITTYNKGYITKVYDANFFNGMNITGLSSGAAHTIFTTGVNELYPTENFTAYGAGYNTYREQGDKNPAGNIFKPVKK